MRGNIFGKMLSLTSFGESHGPAMGAILDGVPAGLAFSQKKLQEEVNRRSPGKILGTTTRQEPDCVEILSGIFESKTLGTPIAAVVFNRDQRSEDYESLKSTYRPGHADQTTLLKYGHRDHRGGGRASGRETLARVIAGHFASLIIPQIFVKAYLCQLGPFVWEGIPPNLKEDFSPYAFPDPKQNGPLKDYLLNLQTQGESCGGRVGIVVDHCPTGLGEPAFDKLKADLAKALLSIGGVVSFSYGLGEKMATLSGTKVSSEQSHFGGMEGGMSNGGRLTMQIVFKPTSTVGEKAKQGRHDPCIIPRAIPVVEAMVKFVLADHFLRQKAYEL